MAVDFPGALRELEHTLIALAIQGALWLATGDLWIGAAIASALWVGREQAQAEYKWIDAYGNGRRANLPSPFHVFSTPKLWDVHSWFWNLTLPIAVVVTIAVTLQH
jgi:hypothetical protein